MNTVGAKAAWLSKLDTPSWGTKAGFMNPVPAAATIAAAPSEDAAQAAWLAKLDTPVWGRAAAPTLTIDAAAAATSEAAAKAAWLAKLDTPAWGQGRVTPTARYSEPVSDATFSYTAAPVDTAATREAAAKAAWLAKLDLAAATTAEAFAKAAWLAERDAFFGATHASAPAPVALAPAYAVPACASTNEAAAKAAWLAKLDAADASAPADFAATRTAQFKTFTDALPDPAVDAVDPTDPVTQALAALWGRGQDSTAVTS
jgi:hypothetical protein